MLDNKLRCDDTCSRGPARREVTPVSYTWVTGGFDILGTPPMSSNQITSLDLPANAILKKVLVRNTNVGLFCSGVDQTAVQPMYLSLEIRIAGGVHDNRIIRRNDFDVPFEVTSDFAVGITTYLCWWHANDLQLGVNAKMSYAMGPDPTSVDFTVALNPLSPPFTAPSGDWHMGYAALYRL
jgi:hypothetical protein